MGAEETAVFKPKSILHVPGGMVGGDVEGVEIVMLGFHLGSVDYGEAQGGEELLQFLLDLGYRVQGAGADAGGGGGEVEPLGIETVVEGRFFQCGFARGDFSFQVLLGVVENFALRAAVVW